MGSPRLVDRRRVGFFAALLCFACSPATPTQAPNGLNAATPPTPQALAAVNRAPMPVAAAGASANPQCKDVFAAADVAGDEHATPAVPDRAPLGMLAVAGGTFAMGADDEGEQDERPRHSVTVGAFWLDETEVTVAAYAECVAAGVCRAPDSLAGSRLTSGHPEAFKKGDHPVVGVSWFDASGYCAFRGKRLPTEAEWERAARGDDGRHYVWGNEAPDPARHGVFGGRLSTEPVGSYPAGRGPYGHLDLAGNVWEWMADEYDPYAYRRESAARGVPGSCAEILETQNLLRKKGLQGFTGKNPIPNECERVLRGAPTTTAWRCCARRIECTTRRRFALPWRGFVARRMLEQ